MQRRSLLKLGFAASVVLGLAGGSAASWAPGLERERLTPASREILRSVAEAVLDGSLPQAPAHRAAALAGLLDRVDLLVAGLPPHAQQELSQLLALLATGPGRRALAGLAPGWAQASTQQVQAALQVMRTSGFALRQQAYLALHDIAAGAYFSEPSTWAQMGYPGPRPV